MDDTEKPLNPRRAAFVQAYANPESPTFGNAAQSYISAGAPNTPAARVTASQVLSSPNVQSEVQRALAAAGVTRERLTRGMLRYFEDEDTRVRSASVRAGEILMRASGMLSADTNITIDARSILLPGSAEASVSDLEAALSNLETPNAETD